MKALWKYISKNKIIIDKVKNEQWCKLLMGYVKEFVDITCCPKVPHPDLKYGTGSLAFIPKFIKQKCAEGKCNFYSAGKTFNIQNYKELTNNNEVIQLLEWKNKSRVEFKKNGNLNT